MTISLVLCSVSLGALVVMAINKNKEMKGGRAMFAIGSPSLDSRIVNIWGSMVYMITHVSVRSSKRLIKQTVLKVERFFIVKFEQLAERFSLVGHIVTGYDLPRNRGSVSFFLKNIEDHKKTMKTVSVKSIK